MKTREAVAKLRALNVPGAIISADFFNLIIDALQDVDARIAALEKQDRSGKAKRPGRTTPCPRSPKA